MFGESDEDKGIQHMIHKTLKHCPMILQKELSRSLVICGGSTCFKNFDKRLINELQILDKNIDFGLSDQENKPNLRYNQEVADESELMERKCIRRQTRNFQGACIIANLKSFKNSMLVSKLDYEEYGFEYHFKN